MPPVKTIAYIKGGDAATELEEVGPSPEQIPEGGPRLYITSVLNLMRGADVLVISMGYAERTVHSGRVTARTSAYAEAERLRRKGWWLRLRTLASIVRQVVRFKPDLVYCPLIGPPLWAATLAARLSGAKQVHSRHSMAIPTSNPISRFVRALDRLILRRLPAMACHGRFLEEQLLADGIRKERIFRFEPGFRSFRESLGDGPPPAPEPTILFVGRAVRNKGTMDLFHAAAPLLRQFPNLRLAYVGGGPDIGPLEEAAREENLSGRVEFIGKVPHHELARIMARAMCVVTPTRSDVPEGRNKAAAESLAVGRPVVAPDFGPFRHYLQHRENALLYPPDSVEGLREALKELVADQTLLDRLAKGAARAGDRILDPERPFCEAIALTFARAGFDPPVSSGGRRT